MCLSGKLEQGPSAADTECDRVRKLHTTEVDLACCFGGWESQGRGFTSARRASCSFIISKKAMHGKGTSERDQKG